MSSATHNQSIGREIYALCEALYPICRSITGNGVRETLTVLNRHIDLKIHEIPSGTRVFDWTIPKEWNIRDAWIKDEKGNLILDFKNHNLHILNYSIPVHKKVRLPTLKKHLYTLPDYPDWIPYRTSYYQPNWGFCIPYRQYTSLQEGAYEVKIDASLEDGHLTYGELYIPGETKKEILFSAHICHPSLANDNLSGISILTHLAKQLLSGKNRFSYRFLFIPGTIGSIAWLAQNKRAVKYIEGGLVASLLGDSGDFTYKKSRRGNTETDFVVQYVLKKLKLEHQVRDFIPYGYDERQFCSPGFDLAVGNLTRSQFGEYPEYHTSADNLQLIKAEYLETSFQVYREIVRTFENSFFYKNLFPYCEPQLSKRGLYDAIGGNSDSRAAQMAILWILNLSDGAHSLLRIAAKSGLPYELISATSELLARNGLIESV